MSDDLSSRLQANKHALAAQYDFIVCGSGSSGSVVARRLAENPAVSVLLLEAGGSDDVQSVMDARSWPVLRRSEQNWLFRATPNPHLNGRAIPMAMGRVLGGGSGINVMTWSRGHRNDWDFFAEEAGDSGWNYQSVLQLYRRIEDWHGQPDPSRRGTGGPVFVQPAPDPHPLAPAMLEAFAAAGVPTFADHNGTVLEGDGGAALTNVCIRDGRRQSIFRAYVHPYLDRPNLTVVSEALVTRLLLRNQTATGVELLLDGTSHRVSAMQEVVLSLGAIHTPKLLMQSGIGDATELERVGIRVLQHLPGVGRNLQDHFMAPCVWESRAPVEGRNNLAEATAIWKSESGLGTPDLQTFMVELPYASPEAYPGTLPQHCWSLTTAVLREASRGQLRLTGPDPRDPIEIDVNFLADPADLRKLKACIAFCRDIGNSASLRPFAKREILPGAIDDFDLEQFMRNATVSHSHQCATAKMGRGAMSVVDHALRVYGIDRLRIADGSILPRITAGNTMAPCVVIGERAADMLKAEHGL